MEDSKLQKLHETLKALAPKGKVGGLGFYAKAGHRSRRSAADGMPEDKRALYSFFVRAGDGPSGHTHFADEGAPASQLRWPLSQIPHVRGQFSMIAPSRCRSVSCAMRSRTKHVLSTSLTHQFEKSGADVVCTASAITRAQLAHVHVRMPLLSSTQSDSSAPYEGPSASI